jgi:Mn-dependent DtxR family transcriptional regulator
MSDFKGVWIPAKVWECKELSLIEKCFLCKIYSLDNNEGCTAGNAFFAEFFDVSKSRCTQILKVLEDAELIKITLFRDGKEIVKRVVNLLNRGIEFFNEGSEKIKQGSEFIKQGSEKIKEGYLENSADKNRELRIEDKNKIEEEEEGCVKKEPTHQQNEDFNILKDLILKLSLEVESLKAEKEKEKSSAKKEKEEVVGDTPPPTPPHQTDLNQAKNIPMWKFEILENPIWETTPEKVQKAFWSYCEMRQELESRGITTTAVLQNLKKVELFLKSNTADIVISCLELAIEAQNKAFDPMFVTNRKNGAFKSTKEKPLHNNDLVMKSESLNHLNKWNKAK